MAQGLADFLQGWLGGPRGLLQADDRRWTISQHCTQPTGEMERDQRMGCPCWAMAETVVEVNFR